MLLLALSVSFFFPHIQNLPKLVITLKGLLPLGARLFHDTHQAFGPVLFAPVDPDDIIGDRIHDPSLEPAGNFSLNLQTPKKKKDEI
jgi:hypothetical protein